MPKLTVMVGPPGSGKSTIAKKIEGDCLFQLTYRISQDDQGKAGHWQLFQEALKNKRDIVVDRMNFNVKQREKYITPAKAAGYEIHIVVLHENYTKCLHRMKNRYGHPTITDEEGARDALKTFFCNYERPTKAEGFVEFRYPEPSMKLNAILIDIDGTAADIEHRVHHVRNEDKKKRDWASFFREIGDDKPNEWCKDIINSFKEKNLIVFCSGRPDSLRKGTEEWLKKHGFHTDELFMRPRADHRQDNIVKEIILDFEVLTRYKPKFVIDDRKQVVDMWRSRGITCLQCAEGDF